MLLIDWSGMFCRSHSGEEQRGLSELMLPSAGRGGNILCSTYKLTHLENRVLYAYEHWTETTRRNETSDLANQSPIVASKL